MLRHAPRPQARERRPRRARQARQAPRLRPRRLPRQRRTRRERRRGEVRRRRRLGCVRSRLRPHLGDRHLALHVPRGRDGQEIRPQGRLLLVRHRRLGTPHREQALRRHELQGISVPRLRPGSQAQPPPDLASRPAPPLRPSLARQPRRQAHNPRDILRPRQHRRHRAPARPSRPSWRRCPRRGVLLLTLSRGASSAPDLPPVAPAQSSPLNSIQRRLSAGAARFFLSVWLFISLAPRLTRTTRLSRDARRESY
mmetsp:Transcript_6693/g.20367  ORF Transcript_6693/g.20367 Transcript_6693/m.20367 type:complete len:254 (-) Transcript_6693:127-888(-)